MLTMVSFSGMLHAQVADKKLTPFRSFVNATRSASVSSYLALPGKKVKDTVAFEEMRQHILNMYRGVKVSHSFMLRDDAFDCVPTLQQPTARMLGLKTISSPPPSIARPLGAGASGKPSVNHPINVSSQLGGEQFDPFGNSLHCENHTIPMRRLTLEDITRFATLHDFLAKGPGKLGQRPHPQEKREPLNAQEINEWANAYQVVANLGDRTTINLWSPYVDTNAGGVFSLSQSWTATFDGQSVEVGWQNYPDLYGDQNARLFIYWTADNYNSTGCYNLDCDAFVQVDGNWNLGGSFNDYSIYGGQQYEFTAEFYLYQGNWWLALGGDPNNGAWVGYYPGSLFSNGHLGTQADYVQFGTESNGDNFLPAQGSGDWPNFGFGNAAYQRGLFYFGYPNADAEWSQLTPYVPSPNCISIDGPYWGDWNPPSNNWGIYSFFGGPGGFGC